MRIPNILWKLLLCSQIQMMKTNRALQKMFKNNIHVNARSLPAFRWRAPERNTSEFHNYTHFRARFRNEEQIIICFGCTGGEQGIWKVMERIFLLGIRWKLFTLAILIILLISILLALRGPLISSPLSPLLLQFSIPFDFVTKICKSETYISPDNINIQAQGIKRRSRESLHFQQHRWPFSMRSLTSRTACSVINAWSTFTNAALMAVFLV